MDKFKKAIECMAQHIKTFHEQSLDEKTADFGEPCERCHNIKECQCNWLSIMKPLLEQSTIEISLARPEHSNTQDSEDSCHG